MIAPPSGDPRDGESVSLQLDQLLSGQIRLGGHLLHVFVGVGSEVSRVVRVDGDLDAPAKQSDNLLALEIGRDDAVGHGAAGQPDALLQGDRDELFVGDDVGAVVDAVDLQLGQGLPDMRDRVGLVDVAVRRQQEAFLAGALEDGGEFRGRVVALVRVQPHADDGVLERQRLHQRRHGEFRRVVAQETHDQARRYPQRALRRHQALPVAAQHRRERDAPARVRLRVEEEFGVLDVLRMRARQVREGQVPEVVLRLEDRHVRVIHGQERGQVVECVATVSHTAGFIMFMFRLLGCQ